MLKLERIDIISIDIIFRDNKMKYTYMSALKRIDVKNLSYIPTPKSVLSNACLLTFLLSPVFPSAETNLENFDTLLTNWNTNGLTVETNQTDVRFQNITVTNSPVTFNLSSETFTISPAAGRYMVALNPNAATITSDPGDDYANFLNLLAARTILDNGGTFDIDSYLGLASNTFYNTLNIPGDNNSRPTNVSVISKDISLSTGVTYKFHWAYAAQDYDPFKDGVFFSYSRSGTGNLVILSRNGPNTLATPTPYISSGTTGYPAGTLVLGDFGSTSWNKYSFTVSSTGIYKVAFGAFNAGDSGVDPILFVTDELGTIIGQVFSFISGPNSEDTMTSMRLSADRLKSAFNIQSAALINGLTYDCQVFDKNNICLSTGGRYSVNSGDYGSTASALLIGSYRLNENVRIGAWVDQNLSTKTGAGINLGNSKPLFGVFGAWSENPTGEGYEVKVSAGYGTKDLTVTRDVIGTAEAGVGNSKLKTMAVSSVSSYGFRLNNQVLASPYVGIRYSKIASNAYAEASSDMVAPLTYSKLAQENVALMAGLRLSAKLDPMTTFVVSTGIEQNLKNRSGQYSATGVEGLTPIEFNSNPKKTRVTASLGAYYDIDKTQRIGLNAIHRQEAFQSTSTTTALATYTVGF